MNRAAVLAALTFGILGLAGLSAPSTAAATAADTVIGTQPIPQIMTFPAALMPAVAAVATRIEPTPDDPATALDGLNDRRDDAASHFQSLADAVASQSAPADPGTELRCLAGAIYYEAKSEPLAGQLAVAEVIINRSRSGRFPGSLCGVVTQSGQFSFVRSGAVPAVDPGLTQWKTALAVAQVALGDSWESPAADAMYFHARFVRPSWAKARVASIGNHVFYR